MPNTYLCTNGERLTQSQINHRLSRAKKGFIERYVCESCGNNSRVFAAWSHTISQKRCKEIHKTELIWEEENGSWDCHDCHRAFESYKSGEFQKHLNFKKRMEFIAKHDPIGFNMRCNYLTYPDLIAWAEEISKIPTHI